MKHCIITFALIASSMTAHAASFIVGMEDMPAGGDNDFNDVIALISGSVAIHSSGVFSALTAPSVDQSGNPFWNHLSSDGPNLNIGNYTLGNGGFSGGPRLQDPEYLSTISGGIADFYFTGTATISIVGGITGGTDTFGVCPIVGCTAANTIWITNSLTYSPGVAWQLTGTNIFGAQWFSDFGPGQTSEFAAFQGTSAVPEPGTSQLAGVAILGLGLVCWRAALARRRHSKLS